MKKIIIFAGIGIGILLVGIMLFVWMRSGRQDADTETYTAIDTEKPESFVETPMENSGKSVAGSDGHPLPFKAEPIPLEGLDASVAPVSIAQNKKDSFLITDAHSMVVWKYSKKRSRLFAGTRTPQNAFGEHVGGYVDSDAINSAFRRPWGIAPFLDGWAISDTGNDSLRLIQKGRVQTINVGGSFAVGNPVRSDSGLDPDNAVIFEGFKAPTGLASDEEGNLYVSDTQHGQICMIDPTGKISVILTNLSGPTGLCWHEGALYIAETDTNRILRYADDIRSTFAGTGKNGYRDGEASSAEFRGPQGVAVDAAGVVYVSDTVNSAIRVIRDGVVETLYARDTTQLDTQFVSPVGLCVTDDALYVCDSFSRQVYVFEAEE